MNNKRDPIEAYLRMEEYKWFWVRKTRSEKEAFEGECRDWHGFIEDGIVLDNKIHPDEPDDKLYPCPIDGCDERRGRVVKCQAAKI